MGYNLYLVKEGNWFDDGNRFTQAEYDAIQKKHQADWLYFDGSSITVKNPEQEQIAELVGIAVEIGWSVQSDDGEFYGKDNAPIAQPASPKQGFFEKINAAVRRYLAARTNRRSTKDIICPFKTGDRVRTMHRSGGVVIEVDPKGNHGMGSIKVRFPDGAVIGSMFIAHDFEKEQK